MHTEHTAHSSDASDDHAAAVGDAVHDAAEVHPSHEALRDAMWRGHGGFEMVMSPLLIGLAGWFLDGALGTRPLFTVVGVVLGFAGSVANQYYRYQARMEALDASRRDTAPTIESARFGRVEAPAVDTAASASIPSASPALSGLSSSGRVGAEVSR